jgi:hypothetical protein
MKFGRSAQEAAQEPSRSGGSGDFIRYLKEGSTTLRILQEPEEWLYYWEHFSPGGFSFPCPRGVDDPKDDCPGCSSDNEKMSKVSRKIAFNVLTSFNGTEYVNGFKIGPMVGEKLENRFKRLGTLTDRNYTITKYKTSQDRWDFDVEGDTPTPVDLRKEEWKDIEALLAQSYDDAWGDPSQAQANLRASNQPVATTQEVNSSPKRPTIAPAPKQEEPPFEQTYQESDLRAMDRDTLVNLIQTDMKMVAPSTLRTSDAIVDWLMELQS